ncbi:hypothetical protein TI39_contig321g00009 [Zymoseptoria brevis]|uniref:Heterokaryon incompatibility domain-containing protein n=1 Tax=Zymoseptoria brevis TaxID=1047168 RepID=A0A0F4GWM4_9PEZI|nr:hypothetical protein TI39_contig321g00009 [Zymoseptoria brevis]
MWLLNATTKQLEFFNEQDKYGRYAIFSHVWLSKDQEVTFQDVEHGTYDHKAGWAKVVNACRRALEDKLDYCWIDTCCVDKTSSAELSEAINSMYRWYHQAKVCYAYLPDVPSVPLRESKWFTRGWTLQELIAPGHVLFYDGAWNFLGSKISMVRELAEITRIDANVLRDRENLMSVSVAARMAWAADRATSREEDRAYSLMGIFDVNMPMLYGEGRKAFTRLQEEIIKISTDHSILVWQGWEKSHLTTLMAPSPYGFRYAHNILSWDSPGIDESFQLSNKGLRISLPAVQTPEHPHLLTAILNCRYDANSLTQIAILLRKQPHGRIVPTRELTSTVCEISAAPNSTAKLSTLRNLDRKYLPSAEWMDLLIVREKPNSSSEAPGSIWTQVITIHNTIAHLEILQVHPSEAWDPRRKTMTFIMTGSPEYDRGYMVFGEKDGNGKRKFGLAFGQEINSGRMEPRIWLTKCASVAEAGVWFKGLGSTIPRKSARVEFKKGRADLSAGVERKLTAKGEVEWVIHVTLIVGG